MIYKITDPLLALKGISRTLREEADDARKHNASISPEALEHYAALLDKARTKLEAQQGGNP